MDLRQIHMEDVFVPRSNDFEGQDQRSSSPGTKNDIFGPFGGLYTVYVW